MPQLQGGQASAAGTGPTSSAGPLPSDQTGKPQIQTVYEGMEAVAHAAKTVSLRGDTERLQLWSSWVDQVNKRPCGRCIAPTLKTAQLAHEAAFGSCMATSPLRMQNSWVTHPLAPVCR